MVTRREQLGTDAHSLPKKTPAKTKTTPSTARGRGKGGGRGGRGKKQQEKKGQDTKEDEVVERDPPNPDEKPKRKRDTTMKRPAASKSAASKPTAPKVDATDKVDIPAGADTEGSASKKPKTWAGRWIPQEDGAPLRKMMAIKQVWGEFIQSKLSGGQSILATSWFGHCNTAFRSADIDNDETKIDKFVAVAEEQVEQFLCNPKVSI